MLNKVVKDEKSEFHAFLDSATESFIQSFGSESLHDVINHWFVGLEESSEQLCGSELKIILVISLFLD